MKRPTERPFLRDVSLHRGLNIVCVEEDVEREGDSQIQVGHGVGKTTFCRLIRYCLDEASFGRRAFRSRVVELLPEGHVALELYVRDVRWSVCRSLSGAHGSAARINCSIEELLESSPNVASYQAFRESLHGLANAVVPPVASDATDRADARWAHLLAWCARDQETRYQTLWDWRSRRSEAGTPAFDRPKAESVRLMARVLGLRTPQEIALQAELDDVERRLVGIDQQLRDFENRYDEDIGRLRRNLALQGVVDAVDAPFRAPDLFTVPLPDHVRARGQVLDDETTSLTLRLQEIGRQLAVIGASMHEARQVIEERETVARVTQAGTTVLETDVRNLQADLEELRRISLSLCRYGQVAFGECEYIQRRIAESAASLADARTGVARDTAQRDQAVAAQQEVARRVSDRLARFDEHHRALLAEQQVVARRIGEGQIARSRLDASWAELQTSQRRRDGDDPDPGAEALRKEQDRSRSRRAALRATISDERSALAEHVRQLSRLFEAIVQRVLSDEYVGRMTFSDEDLEFSIGHGSLMAGEAVETLCVLLADLTALAGGANALGNHPGWLLHDSPREADLGIVIYRRLLQTISTLAVADGEPPFQYIVTTATLPPEALRQRFGRLVLHHRDETGMLFGHDLGREPVLLA